MITSSGRIIRFCLCFFCLSSFFFSVLRTPGRCFSLPALHICIRLFASFSKRCKQRTFCDQNHTDYHKYNEYHISAYHTKKRTQNLHQTAPCKTARFSVITGILIIAPQTFFGIKRMHHQLEKCTDCKQQGHTCCNFYVGVCIAFIRNSKSNHAK